MAKKAGAAMGKATQFANDNASALKTKSRLNMLIHVCRVFATAASTPEVIETIATNPAKLDEFANTIADLLWDGPEDRKRINRSKL